MIERLLHASFQCFSILAAMVLLISASQARAQLSGQVLSEGGTPRLTRLYHGLQELLLSPPEPKLNLSASAVLTHETYDDFSEDGVFTGGLFFGDPLAITIPPDTEIAGVVRSPKFTIDTAGTTFGAEYLFRNGLLVGAGAVYNHADFDFDPLSPARQVRGSFDNLQDFLSAVGLGIPLDRDFDEYGASIQFGYFSE